MELVANWCNPSQLRNLTRNMNHQTLFYVETLRNELKSRQARNSAYSLRALARDFRVDPGTLAAVVSGRRTPSQEISKRLAEALNLPGDTQLVFVKSAAEERRRRSLIKVHRRYQGPNPASGIRVDPRKIPEANRMIQEFTRTLCAFLEPDPESNRESNDRQECYELSISLLPLSR